MTTFYDKSGRPVVYCHDEVHVYAFSGEPLAYFRTNSVYSFNGSHVGWYLNGWIYDREGFALVFSEKSRGGPLRPLKKLKPLRSLRMLRPLKSIRENRPLRPLLRSQWSSLRFEDLLDA